MVEAIIAVTTRERLRIQETLLKELCRGVAFESAPTATHPSRFTVRIPGMTIDQFLIFAIQNNFATSCETYETMLLHNLDKARQLMNKARGD